MTRTPARLIHDLKYHRRIHLAAELGRLAAEAFDDPRLATALAERWPLVPVPLHRSRQHRRHFNQSVEIAPHRGPRSAGCRWSAPCAAPATPAPRPAFRAATGSPTCAARSASPPPAAASSAASPPARSSSTTSSPPAPPPTNAPGCCAGPGVQKVVVVTVMRG